MASPRLPWDINEARDVTAAASRKQIEAEDFRRRSAKDLAQKEETYRTALAKKILDVHGDGCAWTVAQDLARGDQHVAHLRFERDVARGVLDAAEQSGWRHTAERKDIGRLIDWSMRVSLDGAQTESPRERDERLQAA